MAVGRVEQLISLRGENNTGKAVAEAKAGLLGLGAASKEVAEKSGDLERGFRGVKDLVGNLGGANLAPLIDGLGGVEAVIKGFGPALNPLTIGLAAAGAAAYLVYQNLEKTRVDALNLAIAERNTAKETLEGTAKRLGLSKDLLGVGLELQSVDSIRKEAQATALKILEAQNEVDKARIENNKESIRLKDQELVRLKMQIVDEQTRLSIQREADLQLDEAKGKQERARRTQATEEDRINGIMNFRDRINARAEVQTKKLLALRIEEEKILYRLNLGDGDREKKEKRITEIVAERNKLEGEQLADATAVQAKRKEQADKGKQYAADERAAIVALKTIRAEQAAAAGDDAQEVYKLQIEAIRAAEAAEIKAAKTSEGTRAARAAKIQAIELSARAKEYKLQEEAFSRTAEIDKQSVEGAKKVADAQIAAQDALTKAQIATATDPSAKYKLIVADLEIQQQAKLKEVRDAGFIDFESKAKREQAIVLETSAAVRAAEKEKSDALKKTADELNATRQRTIDSAADTISSASSMVAAFQGKSGLGTALVETAKQVKSVSAGWADNKDQAGALIGAVGNVATAFVDGEREKAGILAIMETAQAITAAAMGNIPGAVAHGTAAALYGSIAGGLIGGGGTAPAAAGGGGFAATGGATAGGSGGGGGPTTTVVNFNAPLGTSYEIGKSVVKAQKAAGASGWSGNMAMGV